MPDDNKETVTLKTASGEMVDVIVPAGMSDAEIKTLILSKRPDLFSINARLLTSAKPLASAGSSAMPNKIVAVPGLGNVSFPGTMSDDDVSAAIRKHLNMPNPGGTDANDPRTFAGSLNSYQQAAGQGQTPGANQITGMSAAPPSTGMRDDFSRWTDNVMGDIKYGTDITGVGTVLKKMGAHGVYNGNPQAVGDFMASLPLGLAQATKGAAEVTQSGKTWQGTKDIVGGAAQALTIPSAFMGGPGVEAGAAGAAAASGKVFGNVEKAAQLFNEVKTAAKASEVPVTDQMYEAASKAMELADTGAKGLPRVISKFMNRVTNPDKAPIAWDEARNFFSNVSRLSTNEYQSMNPQMAEAVSKFAAAFDDSLRATAAAAGKGDEYAQAMQLYSTAKSWQKFGANVWGGFKQSLPFTGGGAVGAYAYNKLRELANQK